MCNTVGLYLLLSAVLSLCAIAKSDVSCYINDTVLEQQKACFAKEGLKISLPSHSRKGTRDQQRKDFINSLIDNNPKEICRHKNAYKNALPCIMEQARKCMPTAYQDYLPLPESMNKTVEKLCANQSVMNFDCVKEMSGPMFDCGVKKGHAYFARADRKISPEEILCKAFELSIQCQKEVLATCGCVTTRIYTDVFIDYLYPPACPPINESESYVICDDENRVVKNKQFHNGGSSRSFHMGIYLWFFVLIMLNNLLFS